jgi:hypothetical protein
MEDNDIDYYNIIFNLTNVGDEIIINGRIPDEDEQLFNDWGCKIEECDFGTTQTKVTRVSPLKVFGLTMPEIAALREDVKKVKEAIKNHPVNFGKAFSLGSKKLWKDPKMREMFDINKDK